MSHNKALFSFIFVVVTMLLHGTIRAQGFEEYLQQQNRDFTSYQGGKTTDNIDPSSGDGISRSGNSPCDKYTGYGCTKTARDDQLNEIMEEDDANNDQNAGSDSEGGSDADEGSGDGASRSGSSPCETNTGYGCTKTARDDQLNEIMDEDNANFDKSTGSDSEDGSSSGESSGGGTSRSGSSPCETNTGYGCTKTARDDQLNEIMEEDNSNFDPNTGSGSEDGSDSDEGAGDGANRSGTSPCNTYTGYGCTKTARDDQLNEIMEEDNANFEPNAGSGSEGGSDSAEGSDSGDDSGGDVSRSAISGTKFSAHRGKGKFYALVIGINDYQGIAPLKTAVNDATTVASVLKAEYGFATKTLLDKEATRSNIVKALNEYRKKLTSDDSLLVYYAGHGYFVSGNDTSYWLPVDAGADDDTNWIDTKRVTNQLKLMSVKNALIVADSCYSGTITRSANVRLVAGDVREKYVRKMFNKSSRVLIASGGNEPVSDSGGNGHSVFADAFIAALKNPPGDVFLAEELVANSLKESVAGRAAQTPEFNILRNSGHQGGDFVFFRN